MYFLHTYLIQPLKTKYFNTHAQIKLDEWGFNDSSYHNAFCIKRNNIFNRKEFIFEKDEKNGIQLHERSRRTRTQAKNGRS